MACKLKELKNINLGKMKAPPLEIRAQGITYPLLAPGEAVIRSLKILLRSGNLHLHLLEAASDRAQKSCAGYLSISLAM